jgi:hypothetical protein
MALITKQQRFLNAANNCIAPKTDSTDLLISRFTIFSPIVLTSQTPRVLIQYSTYKTTGKITTSDISEKANVWHPKYRAHFGWEAGTARHCHRGRLLDWCVFNVSHNSQILRLVAAVASRSVRQWKVGLQEDDRERQQCVASSFLANSSNRCGERQGAHPQHVHSSMNSLSACAQEGLGKIARRRWREGRENCEAKQVTENLKKKVTA